MGEVEVVDETAGDVLKAARAAKHMSLRAAAGQIGVTAPTFMRWEEGDRLPSGGYIAALARFCGMEAGAFADLVAADHERSRT